VQASWNKKTFELMKKKVLSYVALLPIFKRYSFVPYGKVIYPSDFFMLIDATFTNLL
jgi:hypothetical protein